jgi:hypothetical protein
MQIACRYLKTGGIKMYANVTDKQKPASRRLLAKRIFRVWIRRRNSSGVLLGAEVALVFETFRAHATLVVIAVRRGIGSDTVLSGRIRPYWRTARWRAPCFAAGAGIALRMARGAPQCRVSHVDASWGSPSS